MQGSLDALARAAARARGVLVSTGAGVSAESGIPTFRDAQTGLWAKHDPVMLASVEGFREDPLTVWRWYDERRQAMRAAQPNSGHLALAEWEALWLSLGREFCLATQNIDGLHQRAGSRNVIELHGSIWEARPDGAGFEHAQPLEACPLPDLPPVDANGRLLRPNVVWFGEMLDPRNQSRAFELAQRCDLLIVAGSSSVVYPAAALPLLALESRQATVVEINPQPTELSALVHHRIAGPSGEVLPQLLAAVRRQYPSAGG